MTDTKPNSPIGMFAIIAIIALAAGAAGGFIGGHLKGKAENAVAVADAAKSVERAEIALKDSEAKAGAAEERLKSTKDEGAKLAGRLSRELAEGKQELANLRTAAANAKAKLPEKPVPTVKKLATFDEAIESVQTAVEKMSEIEPKKSEAVTKNLAADEIGVKFVYEDFKSKWNVFATPIDNVDVVSQLNRSGYTYATQLFTLKRALNENDTVGLFKKLWSPEWETATLIDRMIYFRSRDVGTRIFVKESIMNDRKPVTANAKIAIIQIAGRDYLDKLK